MQGQFAYHFKPKEMSGTRLIPLNQLREKMPKVYQAQVQKYKGREELMQVKIPLMDCLWNDVLHMSPINPQMILDTWRHEGLHEFAGAPTNIEVYKIPTALLDESQTVCFQSYNYDFQNYKRELDKYWHFKSQEYKEYSAVDPQQLAIWKEDFKHKRRFLWYSHTMHILARQEINTADCELFICK